MNRILKKIIVVLTVAALVFSFSGSAFAAEVYTNDITAIGDKIRQTVAERGESAVLYYKSESNKLTTVPFNDELYKVTDEPYEGDYLKYNLSGVKYTMIPNSSGKVVVYKSGGYYHFHLRATPSYRTTLEQQEAVSAYVDELVDSQKFTFMDSEYFIADRLYRSLVSSVSYEENLEEITQRSTVYDAVTGVSDSQGIAVLTYAAFKRAGLEARIVSGISQKKDDSDTADRSHYWNIVKIGDLWYNIDVSEDSVSEEISHFLVSDNAMEEEGNMRSMESANLDKCESGYFPEEEEFDIGLVNVPETGKIQVAWKHVDGAEYYVYRSTQPGVTDVENDTPYMELSDTSFVDDQTTAGKKYYYTVKAVSGDDTYVSVERFRCTDLAAPAAKSQLLKSSIKVSWTKVPGAKKYYVYRSTSPDKGFKLVKTTTSRVYYHKTAKKGVRYYYKVKASNGNKSATSAFSNMAYRTYR